MVETAAEDAARIAHVAAALIRRLRTQSGGDEPLSLTQDWALALLVDSDGMTGAELARAQNVRAQTMSTALSGLEDLGYVARSSHPTDARRIVMTATEAGVAAMTSFRDAKQRWLRSVIADFSADERETLAAGLALLERIAEEPTTGP